MTFLICGAVAVVYFLVGFVVACLLGSAKFSDMLSANDYLQKEVERWRKEFEDLNRMVSKRSR
jgi:hypothetical protein